MGIFDNNGYDSPSLDPGWMGLLGLAGGFAQGATPVGRKGGLPLGMTIGNAAQAMGTGMNQAYTAQEAQAKAAHERMQNQVLEAQVPGLKAQAALTNQIWSSPDALKNFQRMFPSLYPGQDTTSPTGAMPGGATGAAPAGDFGTDAIAGRRNMSALSANPPTPDLTTIKSPGGVPFTVAKAAAPAFQGLLADLEAQGYKINPDQSGGYNPRKIAGTDQWSNHAFGTALDINWQNNPRGDHPTQQDLPPNIGDLAAKHGLTWGGNWSGASRDPMHFELANQPPYQVAGPISAQGSGGVSSPAPGGTTTPLVGPQGVVVPRNGDEAAAVAQQYMERANRADMAVKIFGSNPMLAIAAGIKLEDPAALREAAKDYRHMSLVGPEEFLKLQAQLAMEGRIKYAGERGTLQAQAELKPGIETAIALGKAGAENVPPRGPGGLGRIETPGGPMYYRNPTVIEGYTPTGEKRPFYVEPPSPPIPGVSGTGASTGRAAPVLDSSGKPLVTGVPQQQQSGRTKAVDDFLTRGRDSFEAANNSLGWLNQIDHAASIMNTSDTPWAMTGPLANERLGLLSTANDIARSLGMTKIPFDQNAVASWEEMKKATTTAGFELSSKYEGHARQAAATIMNATSAIPGPANSPLGLKLVSSGIREGANSAIDLRQYEQSVFNLTQGAGLENAATDFYTKHPATQYADRAISNVTPFHVKGPEDFEKYLPGTFVTIDKLSPTTGKPMIVQVPPREEEINGVRFTMRIPTYMERLPNG